MSIPNCIVTNLQFVSIFSRFRHPCYSFRDLLERDPSKKSDRRTTPCIFDGSSIVGYPVLSRSIDPVSKMGPSYFSGERLKNQPRVKCIQDAPEIFNGEILQYDLRQMGRIYICVYVCVYV